jgi:hypothetical protein
MRDLNPALSIARNLATRRDMLKRVVSRLPRSTPLGNTLVVFSSQVKLLEDQRERSVDCFVGVQLGTHDM